MVVILFHCEDSMNGFYRCRKGHQGALGRDASTGLLALWGAPTPGHFQSLFCFFEHSVSVRDGSARILYVCTGSIQRQFPLFKLVL